MEVIINNNIYHKLNGQFHNPNGPAKIFSFGTRAWYIHGERHREDGPSVEFFNIGSKIYFLNNKRFSERKYEKYSQIKLKHWMRKVLNKYRDSVVNFNTVIGMNKLIDDYHMYLII